MTGPGVLSLQTNPGHLPSMLLCDAIESPLKQQPRRTNALSFFRKPYRLHFFQLLMLSLYFKSFNGNAKIWAILASWFVRSVQLLYAIHLPCRVFSRLFPRYGCLQPGRMAGVTPSGTFTPPVASGGELWLLPDKQQMTRSRGNGRLSQIDRTSGRSVSMSRPTAPTSIWRSLYFSKLAAQLSRHHTKSVTKTEHFMTPWPEHDAIPGSTSDMPFLPVGYSASRSDQRPTST